MQLAIRYAMTCLVLVISMSANVSGQSLKIVLADLKKNVLKNPTTYETAAIDWVGLTLDWNTSQTFFRHDYRELNAEFTISGKSNDRAIGYGAGNVIILRKTGVFLSRSVLNNASASLVASIIKIKGHPKLARTLFWTETILYNSVEAYIDSGVNYRQFGSNRRVARQLGF